MVQRGFRAVALFLLVPAAPAAAEIVVDHAGIQCVVAERFPRLEARVPAGAEVARGRIHFRPEGSPGWYFVEMTRAGAVLSGVLPRPSKSLAAFHYYIEVTDAAFAAARTAEYAPVVADNAAGCAGKIMAASETAATVVLMPPGGAPPIPIGFAPSGVTPAAASAGAAASGATATGAAAGSAAAGGGGIGATTLIVGGAAVAAGAAIAVTSGGGDDGSRDGSGGGTGSGDGSGGGGTGGGGGGGGGTTPGGGGQPPGQAPVLYSVLFEPSPPGIDVSACAGRSVTWCCQPISVAADGAFDINWSMNDPNTMRVTGRATSTTLQATLTCLNGGASGSISATGDASGYRGSFEFRGQRGSVTIARQ